MCMRYRQNKQLMRKDNYFGTLTYVYLTFGAAYNYVSTYILFLYLPKNYIMPTISFGGAKIMNIQPKNYFPANIFPVQQWVMFRIFFPHLLIFYQTIHSMIPYIGGLDKNLCCNHTRVLFQIHLNLDFIILNTIIYNGFFTIYP